MGENRRIGNRLKKYGDRLSLKAYYKLDESLAIYRDRQAVFEALNLKWKNEVVKMAEAKAQQSTQPVTNENNLLINNRASSPNNKPEELTENHVVDHTTEEWLSPENLADTSALLEACDDVEMLADVRAAVPAYALKEACKLLPKLKLVQIKQWVLHLNSLMVAQVEDIAIATQPSQQEELVTDENLTDTATLLQSCQSVEMLSELRACCSDSLIKKALELIPTTLKQWVSDWMGYWSAEELRASRS